MYQRLSRRIITRASVSAESKKGRIDLTTEGDKMGIPLHGRGATKGCAIFYKRSTQKFLAWSMLQSSLVNGSPNNEFNGSFVDARDLFEYLEILLGRWVKTQQVQVTTGPLLILLFPLGCEKLQWARRSRPHQRKLNILQLQ